MEVFDGADAPALPQNGRIRSDEFLTKRGRLAHETVDDPFVTLGQHGGDDIPFGREVEEGEEVLDLLGLAVFFRGIDVAEFVDQGVPDQPVIPEGKTLLEIQLLLGQRIGWVAIEHGIADVGLLCSQRDIEAVRPRAHGEEEAPTQHEVAHLEGDGPLHFAHFLKAQ